MSESYIPMYILLKRLKRLKETNRKEFERIFTILVERSRSWLEDYARRRLPSEELVQHVTDTTFVEIYCKPHSYSEQGSTCVPECMKREEWSGTCAQEYRCVEKTAWAWLRRIHKCNINDALRTIYRHQEPVQQLDETMPAPPETSTVSKYILTDIIWRAFHSLSESDQRLINYRPGRGRPDKAREQARSDAWKRFREELRKELALSGDDQWPINNEPDYDWPDKVCEQALRDAWEHVQEAMKGLEEE